MIEEAKTVLKTEAEGILYLMDHIGHEFTEMAQYISDCKGRVVIGGIGKSGLIGKKIVATLNSTGTKSIFLHPVEAMHGDLGMVCKDDVFLALSNSGETQELIQLIPNIRSLGCKIIAITGNYQSTLAKMSDLVVDVHVPKEACPLGLAPTTSTTALLAIGDALAVVLINKKQFNSKDFKKFHPGGNLGQRLSCQVKDLMLTDEYIPILKKQSLLIEAIRIMDAYRLGVVFVTEEDLTLIGLITDGDIRHFIAQHVTVTTQIVDDIMTKTPKMILPDAPVYDALNIMEQYQITVLPVVDKEKKIKGTLHLHEILGKGAFKFYGTDL